MTHRHDSHRHDYGPSYSGTVMLDIGPGVGALVIVTGPELLGHEIEISAGPEDPLRAEGAARTHVAVRERRLGDHIMYCAVYPSLPEGTYTIWDGDRAVRQVRVNGAEVYQSVLSTAEFRSAASASSVGPES
jgi:hypothetical protein